MSKKLVSFAFATGLLTFVACTDYETMFEDDYGFWDASGDSNVNTGIDNENCVEGEKRSVVNDNNRYFYQCLGDDWIFMGVEPVVDGNENVSTDVSPDDGEVVLPTVPSSGVCSDGATKQDSDSYYIYDYVCEGGYWTLKNYIPKENTSPSSSSSKKSSSSAKPISSIKSSSSASSLFKLKNTVCGDLWCGSKRSYRVDTGLDDGSDESGYFFSYSDANSDGGSSYFEFPVSFGNAYSDDAWDPIIDYCGGVCGKVNIVPDIDIPYAGIGFNVTGPTQIGADLTDWGGLCIVYAATGIPPVIELSIENEMNVTGYNNPYYRLSASSTVKVLDLPWSKFKQEEDWGIVWRDVTTLLTKVAAIKFKFSGTMGNGEFNIMSIGRYGTCN